ncbi:hypothetical protein [Hymenobacter guriensis]|uniref:Uncharacterized protein n=1 Tax=Hymenobacter guriensis TaxID=2793065 RepID=A0ABS0L138_9BACT|nr:hypothetical protein [Hymenobacter guriensis]MBG8553082.1 hypothetical protein [Hymenobacter guriensis]
MFTFQLTSDILPAYTLEVEPIGWAGLTVVLARDPKYHGVTHELAGELTFVKKGGDYLRQVYEAKGVEGLVVLTAYLYNPNEFRREEVTHLRVDFTQYSVTERGVSIKLRQTGFTTKLLNRDKTEVDIFRNESVEGVALPPLGIARPTLYSQVFERNYYAKTTYQALSPTVTVFNGESRFYTLYFSFGSRESDDFIDEFGIGQMANTAQVGTSPAPIFTATEDAVLTIEAQLFSQLTVLQEPGSAFPAKSKFHHVTGVYYLRVINKQGVLTFENQLSSFDKDGISEDFEQRVNFPINETLNLLIGDQLYLYAALHVDDIDENYLLQYSFDLYNAVNPGSFLRLRATTTTPETGATGLLVHEALERTVQAITDRPGPALYSDYFGRTDTTTPYQEDGPGSLRLVTGGFQLRNFPLAEKPLFVSFRDLYDSLDAIDCLGMGVERRNGLETVRIEPRAFFYQPAAGLQLQQVAGLSKRVHADLLYSSAEVGFQRWESDAPNGLDEPNSERTYALPLSQVSSTYTAKSPYATAGYLIEATRRQQYKDANTKEGGADNTKFLISLRREGGLLMPERNEAFATVVGVLAPGSTYNLRLTPGRMLRAHGPWLRAGLVHREDRKLQRGAGGGNSALVTRLLEEASQVAEAGDVPVLALNPPYVLPEVYEFTCKLTLSQLEILRRQSYAQVSFLDSQGNRKAGYLLRAEYKPQSGETSFTLLRAAAPVL